MKKLISLITVLLVLVTISLFSAFCKPVLELKPEDQFCQILFARMPERETDVFHKMVILCYRIEYLLGGLKDGVVDKNYIRYLAMQFGLNDDTQLVKIANLFGVNVTISELRNDIYLISNLSSSLDILRKSRYKLYAACAECDACDMPSQSQINNLYCKFAIMASSEDKGYMGQLNHFANLIFTLKYKLLNGYCGPYIVRQDFLDLISRELGMANANELIYKANFLGFANTIVKEPGNPKVYRIQNLGYALQLLYRLTDILQNR